MINIIIYQLNDAKPFNLVYSELPNNRDKIFTCSTLHVSRPTNIAILKDSE